MRMRVNLKQYVDRCESDDAVALIAAASVWLTTSVRPASSSQAETVPVRAVAKFWDVTHKGDRPLNHGLIRRSPVRR